MFNNNSISISVSDDEPDELGRMRVRVRRKRKKTGHRLKNEFLHRVVRKLVRYWALLIFLPALGLLLYEASRIGRKPSSVANTELGASEKSTLVDSELSNVTNPSLEKKSDGNLNRLGCRRRCLKILSPEELEHLEIPVREEANSPVSKVLYISEIDTPFLEGNSTLSQGNSTLSQEATWGM
ncbi:hypothetical protein Pyn_11078 [Prunus yedoensis var. nudiflora]|uniref:Uncharacterized protein n=1 Tax=Prunus yedoensis var. nudiflora TaxID=2094558 RepID=A0A314YBA6_PRUYE|nr:hypothetical protein Pyn_11078 [Prunus yedoensis var. nudiflora]